MTEDKREYHVIVVPIDREGNVRGPKNYMTGYPMTHAECLTFMSKATRHPSVSHRLEPVGPETSDYQAIVDACAERDARGVARVCALFAPVIDLDNDGELVKAVRALIERAVAKAARSC